MQGALWQALFYGALGGGTVLGIGALAMFSKEFRSNRELWWLTLRLAGVCGLGMGGLVFAVVALSSTITLYQGEVLGCQGCKAGDPIPTHRISFVVKRVGAVHQLLLFPNPGRGTLALPREKKGDVRVRVQIADVSAPERVSLYDQVVTFLAAEDWSISPISFHPTQQGRHEIALSPYHMEVAWIRVVVTQNKD